jgi:hypothetical protein
MSATIKATRRLPRSVSIANLFAAGTEKSSGINGFKRNIQHSPQAPAGVGQAPFAR